MIKILGEEFDLDKDDNNSFIISHPKWSILGWGFTYESAHSHLLEQIETTKNFYKDIPDEDFTEQGLKFKQWLMTIKFNKLNKE